MKYVSNLQQNISLSFAYRTNSALPRACVLIYEVEICLFTVFGDKYSSSAISALLRPAHTSRMTRFSASLRRVSIFGIHITPSLGHSPIKGHATLSKRNTSFPSIDSFAKPNASSFSKRTLWFLKISPSMLMALDSTTLFPTAGAKRRNNRFFLLESNKIKIQENQCVQIQRTSIGAKKTRSVSVVEPPCFLLFLIKKRNQPASKSRTLHFSERRFRVKTVVYSLLHVRQIFAFLHTFFFGRSGDFKPVFGSKVLGSLFTPPSFTQIW